MPDRLSILCVHGIGHGDVDAALIPAWRQVITAGLQRWKPGLEVDFDFLAYDEEFDHAPLHAATYAEALTRLAASGIVHGIGDLLPGTRAAVTGYISGGTWNLDRAAGVLHLLLMSPDFLTN
jgi:hypothetical protein